MAAGGEDQEYTDKNRRAPARSRLGARVLKAWNKLDMERVEKPLQAAHSGAAGRHSKELL